MLKRRRGSLSDTQASELCAQDEGLRYAGSAAEMGLHIAHEISQPLAAIALHSSAARKWLCREQPNVERALASLDSINEAGHHADDIVRSIQSLASHQKSEIECVMVDQTIKGALRLVQCLLHRNAVRTKLVLTLGDVVIQANRVQFHQVITNLLVNAIEALACSEQSPTVRCIRVASRIVNGEQIEVIVEDNGPGIAPSDRDRMFGSHFTTKPGNSGLGLAICRTIVRAHHGYLEFEPREPSGARFRIRLPLRGSSCLS